MFLALKSSAFANGGDIPRKHTCDGANLSPALSWNSLPPKVHSFALIADDPDAPRGVWTHWVIWNIPAQFTALPEGVPTHEVLPNIAMQGRNDFNRIGYDGPCPPPGKAHRYIFRLYALALWLDLKPGSSAHELERAMKGHVLSQAEWMGKYQR